MALSRSFQLTRGERACRSRRAFSFTEQERRRVDRGCGGQWGKVVAMRRPLRSLRRNRKAAASDALKVYEAKRSVRRDVSGNLMRRNRCASPRTGMGQKRE